VTAVDLRCPVGPRKLLARLRSEGFKPSIVPGNLMELYCRDCSRVAKNYDREIQHLLHRFDLAGDLVETVTVYRDGSQVIQP
jgi:hypothetical protein